MKVVLIYPPGGYFAARWEESALPSLGLGYLGAYLEKNGVNCEIIDAHALRMKISEIGAYLRDTAPDVVGVTFTSENRFIGFDVIRTARASLPGATIVAGGPHVSAAAEDTLRNIPELDLVIRGEGEEAFLAVVRKLEGNESFESVPSVSYRMDGEVVSNPLGPFIADLDSLPFPAWHMMPMNRYRFMADVPGEGKLRALNIMASRGCPFDCSFCASPGMWGRRYRARSPQNVLAEIDELVQRFGAQALWIFDDTFTIDRKRTVSICEGIGSKYPSLRWFCEIRVDTVDRTLLAIMKNAGCFCVAFGVESGSQRIIDQSIGKRIELEQVHQVVAWCRELGLQYNPFMILSHPDETEEDARQSMKLVREWKADGSPISMAIMHVYPGTRVEKIALEKNIIPRDFSWASKKDLRRVPMLPASQGDVPIFIDQLSWEFLSSCLFEWAEMQHYSVLRRIPKAIRSIRTASDVKRYWSMFKTYLARADAA
jgi:radical SAM superfamily enzyme YgiQ (UPF0313 family)